MDRDQSVKIALIVAVAENGVIGRGGVLPWRMPSDLKTFRRLTLGKPVIMGRKTYESIGKPLDGRDNIVVTRAANLRVDPGKQLHLAGDFTAALVLARRLALAAGQTEAMVIGGSEIYRQALPHADLVYLTRVHAIVDGDATFPELLSADWSLVRSEAINRSDKDDHSATLLVYERADR